MTPTQASVTTQTHELQCMEVWGGSGVAEHAASVPGLDICISAQPADGERGGDLYLISACSCGWISRMLLADVAGHGRTVSDLSAKLRRAMHRSINTVDQSKLARALNSAFDAISRGERFATALLMTYYAPSGHLILVNAGHPPPLISRAGGGAWTPIVPGGDGVISQTSRRVRVGAANLPLGVIASTDYEQFAVSIGAGDRVCAYTDAYIEAIDALGEPLGVSGFCALLDGIDRDGEGGDGAGDVTGDSLVGFASGVRARMTAMGNTLADDDHTMMVLAHNGAPPTRLSVPSVGNWLRQTIGLGHTDTRV